MKLSVADRGRNSHMRLLDPESWTHWHPRKTFHEHSHFASYLCHGYAKYSINVFVLIYSSWVKKSAVRDLDFKRQRARQMCHSGCTDNVTSCIFNMGLVYVTENKSCIHTSCTCSITTLSLSWITNTFLDYCSPYCQKS